VRAARRACVPSRKAARYGALAERKAADRYDLDLRGEHTSWCDARTAGGVPVEIKATDLGRDYPRFRIFEEYHEQLQAAGGRYVFVAYKRCGAGIRVVRMTMVHAGGLPQATWTTTGGHRESRAAKIDPSVILSD
jgi:hypothetical protein